MTPEPATHNDRRWVWRAAESAALIGAIAYAVLREEYRVFYNELRVTPDDVGLDPIEIVSGSAFGVLFMGLVVFTIYPLCLLILARRGRLPLRFIPPPRELAAVVLLALVFLHVAVRSEAHRAGACVKAGASLRYVTIAGIPLLNVRAQEAEVRWLRAPTGAPQLKLGPRLLFIGQSDGVVVLYDVRERTPLRIPAADVSIRMLAVTEGCSKTKLA